MLQVDTIWRKWQISSTPKQTTWALYGRLRTQSSEYSHRSQADLALGGGAVGREVLGGPWRGSARGRRHGGGEVLDALVQLHHLVGQLLQALLHAPQHVVHVRLQLRQVDERVALLGQLALVPLDLAEPAHGWRSTEAPVGDGRTRRSLPGTCAGRCAAASRRASSRTRCTCEWTTCSAEPWLPRLSAANQPP